jgi:putative membrane protein
MKGGFNMTFRDRLALDRTYLAKERTILAYMRTGLAMLGVAFFIYRFMDVDMVLTLLVTLTLAVPGIIVVIYGLYKTITQRTERREFEKKYMMVADDGK